MKTDEVFAHCDIPCKIYDPIVIQVAALSVVRILDIINETSHDDVMDPKCGTRRIGSHSEHD